MTPADRQKIQNIQTYLVAHTAQIGYRMLRPMVTRNIATMVELGQLTAKGFSMDCSESVTLICHVAGVSCPTGYTYASGDGNTSTIAAHLLHHYTDGRLALPGAMVVFDLGLPLDKQHVAQVHTPDPVHGDPVLFTHGNAAGPMFLKLSELQPGFTEPAVFCAVSSL